MNLPYLLSRPIEDDVISEAAVVLLFTDHSFLIIKRRAWKGDPWSGQMALPGGHRKEGETAMEAAVREAEEEVGIRPTIIGSLGIFSPHSKQIRVRVFLSYAEKELPFRTGDEVEWAAWVNESQLTPGQDCFYYNGERIWGMTFRILLTALSPPLGLWIHEHK